MFGLRQCGMNDPWLLLSCVAGQQKVTSLSRHQSLVWAHYGGDICAFNSVAFCYQNEWQT